ncbi:MAG: mercury methylation ferredoxin HgcB [Desulfatiglans sp.]|jgi:NAD-dependent dihydropyrimidine dehydrogenase PreA subunit|nr:mercury methylation ferredoxin HgcB [Thermodesulfobacteriota bacterium]MEE4352708.1 mercury methylation ferredoxin HgcB [Desulfatiglans sp.]
MKDFQYLQDVSTLKLDQEICIGCGTCQIVCPHGVFAMGEKKAEIVDGDCCMECGACALNCVSKAISVTPGVGCASYIIQSWIKGKEKASCSCC